jgi:hypothetical protein
MATAGLSLARDGKNDNSELSVQHLWAEITYPSHYGFYLCSHMADASTLPEFQHVPPDPLLL